MKTLNLSDCRTAEQKAAITLPEDFLGYTGKYESEAEKLFFAEARKARQQLGGRPSNHREILKQLSESL